MYCYTYFGTGVGLEGLGRLRISFDKLVLQEAKRDSTDYKQTNKQTINNILVCMVYWDRLVPVDLPD